MNTRQKAKAWDMYIDETTNAIKIGYREAVVLEHLSDKIRAEIEWDEEITKEQDLIERLREINKEENKVIAISDATEEIFSFIRTLGYDDIADEFYKIYWR